jgi:hypothetical protein
MSHYTAIDVTDHYAKDKGRSITVGVHHNSGTPDPSVNMTVMNSGGSTSVTIEASVLKAWAEAVDIILTNANPDYVSTDRYQGHRLVSPGGKTPTLPERKTPPVITIPLGAKVTLEAVEATSAEVTE